MADSVSVRIDGLKELADKLRDLGPKIGRSALRAGVRTGAALVRDEAKLRAPVDTGVMRRAVFVKQVRQQSSATQQTFHVFVRSGKRFEKKNINAYYWRHVEFGTVKMAAKPFLRPAFEARKGQAVDAIADRIRERIQDAGR